MEKSKVRVLIKTADSDWNHLSVRTRQIMTVCIQLLDTSWWESNGWSFRIGSKPRLQERFTWLACGYHVRTIMKNEDLVARLTDTESGKETLTLHKAGCDPLWAIEFMARESNRYILIITSNPKQTCVSLQRQIGCKNMDNLYHLPSCCFWLLSNTSNNWTANLRRFSWAFSDVKILPSPVHCKTINKQF